jgi:hypothetical protein
VSEPSCKATDFLTFIEFSGALGPPKLRPGHSGGQRTLDRTRPGGSAGL